MAYIRFDKFWRLEIYNNVPTKGRVPDKNFNQLKLKVNNTSEKDEKLSTSFQPQNIEYVVNKAQLDTNLSIVKGHISFIEKKKFIEFELHGDEGRQSGDEFVIEKSVKMNYSNTL